MSTVTQNTSSLTPGDVVTQNYLVREDGSVKVVGRIVNITSVRPETIYYMGDRVPVLHVVGIDPARPVDPKKPEKVGWVRWMATPHSKVSVLR